MELKSEIIEGFLAYFDIQGFSNSLKSSDFTENIQKYCNFLDDSTIRRNLNYNFFSDSVVIYTKKVDNESFFNLIQAVSEIYNLLLLELGLVICGGISCGKFTIHENNGNKIIAGTPMVDAVQHEQKQNWIGVMISPEVIKKVSVFGTMIQNELHKGTAEKIGKKLKPLAWYAYLKKAMIPIKVEDNETYMNGFAIFPNPPNITNGLDVLENLREVAIKLEYLKYSAPNPKVVKKLDRTRSLILSDEMYWENMVGVELF